MLQAHELSQYLNRTQPVKSLAWSDVQQIRKLIQLLLAELGQVGSLGLPGVSQSPHRAGHPPVPARAVEQTLIDYHGLGKDSGTLINKINSISAIKNPTKYEQGLIRGAELLKKAGYEGF